MSNGLRFPSPAAFTHSLRLRRANAAPGTKFLVVEGASDKKSFQPLLDSAFHFVPARGKDMVLWAHDALASEGITDCLFIVDCDGSLDAKWLGQPCLIVSTNRDVEADLLFDVSAFERMALEFLSDHVTTRIDCQILAGSLLALAKNLTGGFGVVLDAARTEGVPISRVDKITGTRVRIRMKELGELRDWVQNFVSIDAGEMLTSVSAEMNWSKAEVDRVRGVMEHGSVKLCRIHSVAACLSCIARRFSNGHDLVDVLSLGISQRCGYSVSEAEVARAIRLATSSEELKNWDVANRIDRWSTSRPAA
jgi:hypothetical protein